MHNLILTADGGSRGNPGPAAIGFAVWKLTEPNLTHLPQELETLFQPDSLIKADGKYIGITTNNQAEWQAVILGLNNILEQNLSPEILFICLDSELVVKQLLGIYKVKHPDLKPLHTEAKDLLKKFKTVEIKHIYRRFNTEADRQVNIVLDAR